MSKWINCNTCTPEHDKSVLIYTPNRHSDKVYIGHIMHPSHRGKDEEGNEYYWFITESENTAFLIDEVTHWMPLPEPPSEGEFDFTISQGWQCPVCKMIMAPSTLQCLNCKPQTECDHNWTEKIYTVAQSVTICKACRAILERKP